MRHCRRTHFSCFDFLLEVFHRYVHPEITVEVDDDGVDTFHCIEHSTQVVVVGNLSSPLFALESEFLTYKLIAECLPVIFGISDMVCVVVACGSAKLSRDLTSLECVELFLESIHVNHNLFTESCRTGRLSVGLCKHRHVLPLSCVLFQLVYEFNEHRVIDLIKSIFDGEWHTGVVDVLTGKTEMYEFLVLFEISDLVQLFLYEIFNSLHVVVGYLFDIFHTLCVGFAEVGINLAQGREQIRVETVQLGQRKFAKCDEVFNLYLYAILYKCIL